MPTPDEINGDLDAGNVSPDLPGLGGFNGAWMAFADFTGNWAQNTQSGLQVLRDYAQNTLMEAWQ